jgi:nitrogenase subunit NifH
MIIIFFILYFINRIKEKCPELLNVYLESDLFKLPETSQTSSTEPNNPESMAKHYQVPYLGRLPMDPNMMRACEEGKSFLETYPASAAARPFSEIIAKVVAMTTTY